MGGFKSGSVDGWDDDEETGASESDAIDTSSSAQQDASKEDPSSSNASDATAAGAPSYTNLPWVLTRDSITDGREKTVQLHLQESTTKMERRQQSELEQLLGESVKKADLREAALLVGLQHLDSVSEQLREWGYAIDSDTRR